MHTKKVKLYDSVRPSNRNGNIQVVDDLTITVFVIRDGEVLVDTNPDLQGYHETRASQSIEYQATDESCRLRLRPASPPIRVPAGGKTYELAVESIGEELVDGLRTNYCILAVTECEPS